MNVQFKHFYISLLLLFTAAAAHSEHTSQHKNMSGIDIYYGVVPAEVVQTHEKEHAEKPMHKKGWFSKGVHHLVVTLYDSKTSERVDDAQVTATVTPLGLSAQSKDLERMKINDAVSYGNYFSMPSGQTPYSIVVSFRRPGIHIPIEAAFDYRHPANR